MKKLVYGSLFLILAGIAVVACKKQNVNPMQVSSNSALEISKVKNTELLNSIIQDVNDFLNDNRLFIERDIYANKTIADGLGKESIEFKKGIYPVLKDKKSGYYFSLVNTKIK